MNNAVTAPAKRNAEAQKKTVEYPAICAFNVIRVATFCKIEGSNEFIMLD